VRRIRDPQAIRRAHLREPWCLLCGRPARSAHHVLAKGQQGDDVAANLFMLCGDGTTGCHGRIEARDPHTRGLLGQALSRETRRYLAMKLGGEDRAEAWIDRNYGGP
jgi:hypothetical protein